MKAATVPICEPCWMIEEGIPRNRLPVRLKEPYRETETCYRCQRECRSGIYVRRMVETQVKGN